MAARRLPHGLLDVATVESAIEIFAGVVSQPAGPLPDSLPQCRKATLQSKPLACASASAFNGTRFERPVQLVYMILFSFEVDVLEILLHEAYDEVTHFVLVEARQAHQKQVRKPLLWPQLRLEPRFARFAAKISHVVAPRASSSSNIWHGEERSTRAGMEHIWSRRTAWQLQPWDRVISADTDEILGQPTLHRLRWCGLMHPSGVGAGLWMPMGTLDRAFAPDWTAGGYRYAYATPTIYEWRHLAARRSRLSFGPPSDWGHRLLKPPHAAQRTTLGGIHLCAASGNLASPRLPSPPTHTAHA